MTTFAIQRGGTLLSAWTLEGGKVDTHEQATWADDLLVLPEEERVGFVLEPANAKVEYRIFIGDVPLADIVPSTDDASGTLLGGRLYWRDLPYFDSARGPTKVVVEGKLEGGSGEAWTRMFAIELYIVPSKLGEERYQAMTADLERVSRSLLIDLYGKSRQSIDIRYANDGGVHHSREAELRAIESTLLRMETLLRSIARRPASRVESATRPQQYWGGQRLPPSALEELVRTGRDLMTAPRPVRIAGRVRIESFDVTEHRIVRAFLKVLLRRSAFCAGVAASHIRSIGAERHLRDTRVGEKPTIYESVDVPRIARLQYAVATAQRCKLLALAMSKMAFLRDVPPTFVSIRGGMFLRNNEYRTLLQVIQRFVEAHAKWYEGGAFPSVTKLTWRMFEQWTFLRIVDAFRTSGVVLREWTDALRQNLRSRFIIDFDRGLMFEGQLGQDVRIRFRYEPWIRGRSTATEGGETLHRGKDAVAAWCPDIVIEVMRRDGEAWAAIYAIVLDCKYSQRVSRQHWSGIAKYLEIRSTATGRQIVKQLWIVNPGISNYVASEDPLVEFGIHGPTCESDETVRFRLSVTPEELARDGNERIEGDPFGVFADGTTAYVRRVFSGARASVAP